MPSREIAIRGYIGESIVKQWLQKKYSGKEYEIKPQIVPEVSIQGGGHLDFGVLKNGEVIEVYEVKTQDYIFDNKYLKINKALKYIWNNNNKNLIFKFLGDNNKYKSADFLKAYLILLVPPNENGWDVLRKEGGDKYIILFKEIFEEFDLITDFKKDELIHDFEIDVDENIKQLKKPKKGSRLKKI